MCERCVQLDEKIDVYRQLSTWVSDEPTVREIEKLIDHYCIDRSMLHPPTLKSGSGNITIDVRRPTRTPSKVDWDLDAQAREALQVARTMPRGAEKAKTLRNAGLLRRAADASGIIFARRGRPPK